MKKKKMGTNKLEELLSENEKLLLYCEGMKDELEKIKLETDNCRKEIIVSLERRISNILVDNAKEIVIEEEKIKNEFENEKKQLVEKNESICKEFDEWKGEMMKKCNEKFIKMKESAVKRENELKFTINEDIITKKNKSLSIIENRKRELEISREEWQKDTINEIKSEFEKRKQNDFEKTLSKQKAILEEVKKKIRNDSMSDLEGKKSDLRVKIEKNKEEETALYNRISELDNSIYEKKKHLNDNLSSVDAMIATLSKKIHQCRCKEQEVSLQNLNQQYQKTETEFIISKDTLESSIESLKLHLKSKMEEQIFLKSEKIRLESELIKVESEHKKEIELITEKVKQTLEKKDKAFEQLAKKMGSTLSLGEEYF